MNDSGIIVAPGCYDSLTAKLVEYSGFECAYLSGGSFAATYLGAPDLALTTMTELTMMARAIAAAVDIPVIGDMETGFGSVLNVRRAIREYESAGLAGAHIEDQIGSKHCGHMDGKVLVAPAEMVAKLQTAVSSRRDPDFVIIARCDAIAVEGLDSALARGRLYAEAGADVIYIEAPRTIEEIRAIPRALSVPVLVGQAEDGITPLVPVAELEEFGVKIVTFPRSVRLVMVKAVVDILREIRSSGETGAYHDRMATDDSLQEILGTHEAVKLLTESRADVVGAPLTPGARTAEPDAIGTS